MYGTEYRTLPTDIKKNKRRHAKEECLNRKCTEMKKMDIINKADMPKNLENKTK